MANHRNASTSTVAALTFAAALLSGCGGGTDDAASSTTPSSSVAAQSSTSSTPTSQMLCLEGSRAVPGVKSAAVMGTGSTAVVLVNGAAESGCAWSGLAEKLVAAGHQVYVFDYASDGPPLKDRLAELRSVTTAAGATAKRVVTVGGSRGGCLALIDAASNPKVHAVGVLSCAKVWNRDDPTALSPYLPKVKQPVLEVIAKRDADVPVAEVRRDAGALPKAEVFEVDSAAHGSSLADDGKVTAKLLSFVAGQ